MSRANGLFKGKAAAAQAEAAAEPILVFCPTCMARAKVPATLPKGKRVRCPKCSNTYDPFSASSQGSDRIKVRKNIEAESSGLPEWVWAIFIGAGCGIFFGFMTGFYTGVVEGSFAEVAGGGKAAVGWGILIWTILGVGFFTALGVCISVAHVLTGSAFGGFFIGLLGFIPALLMFDLWIAILAVLVLTGLIEAVIEYKLYS